MDSHKLLLTCILLSLCKGHCQLVPSADPPSGTTIGHLEGQAQITITCNISNFEGNQQTTLWFVQHYKGSSGYQQITSSSETSQFFNITGTPRNDSTGIPHYRNCLTIVSVNPLLDGTILSCGTGTNMELAKYPLRLFIPPSQPYNLSVISAGATWVSVNWEAPIQRGSPPLSRYTVTAREFNSETRNTTEALMIMTVSNETSLNFTGLSPNTMYLFTVVGSAEFLNETVTRSGPSVPVRETTLTKSTYITSVQLVIQLENQECQKWVAQSRIAKIQEITSYLSGIILSWCNCNFTVHQIANQTLQCSITSEVRFRAILYESSNNRIQQQYISKWIKSGPYITIQGEQYRLNINCPVRINSLNTPLLPCEPTTTSMNSSGDIVLLAGVLSTILGALVLVVIICTTVICCMCCNKSLLASRTNNKVEVELSAWDMTTSSSTENNAEENHYEAVSDLVTNPMYNTVEQAGEQQSLQYLYETPSN